MSGRAIASVLVAGTILSLGILLRRWNRERGSGGTSNLRSEPEMHERLIEDGEQSLDDLRSTIASMGKVELHCHLNGSVRKSTLNELLPVDSRVADSTVHTIEDAFAEFKRVYQVVNKESVLRRIVRELLEDAVADDVRYLELRTTPRKLEDIGSRRDYVKIVIDEISRFPHVNRLRPLSSFPKGQIAVRLILTIDRAQPVAVAEQTIDLALRFPEMVVGVDFAGNPTVGTFADFVTVFERARGHGLSITVHTSEIANVEKETDAILKFKPNRMGHFLFPTEEQIRMATEAGIAIESCPSSNMCAVSGKFPSEGDMSNHSILNRFVRDKAGMISINTDDPGVFNVKLSDELFATAKTFKLTKSEIERLILNSARHAFLSNIEREALARSLVSDF